MSARIVSHLFTCASCETPGSGFRSSGLD